MAHRLSREAKAELDGIWDYLAVVSGSMDLADTLLENLTFQFFLIANHPYMGRWRDNELRPGVRSFVVGRYVILYRIDGRDVLILHVVQGSRDLQILFAGWPD